MIQFSAHNHLYTSVIPDDKDWISVTALVHGLCEPFDQLAVATKCSTRKPGRYPNKWYGYTVQEILDAWNGESNRSTELGHWYHNQREQELCNNPELTVTQPIISNGTKVASDQKLTEGIYPEHIVYLENAGICGQVDKPQVLKGLLHINDYKTNKEIKRKGFTNWEGITKKMLKPVAHLDDCEFNHYALQLSIYMYIILKHNPMLMPGKLTIEHVKFEEAGIDKFGYPIQKLDENKQPIVKSVELIEVPYLKSECATLMTWVKDKHNRELITRHK